MTEETVISRRKLLKSAGYAVAGLTLASSFGFLTGCSDKPAATDPTPTETEVPVPQWPLSYVNLEPDKAAQKAYDGYKEDG